MPDKGKIERFQGTVLHEFYQVAFRKRIYGSVEQLQADLDAWVAEGALVLRQDAPADLR